MDREERSPNQGQDGSGLFQLGQHRKPQRGKRTISKLGGHNMDMDSNRDDGSYTQRDEKSSASPCP
jgi:hypothetical protein